MKPEDCLESLSTKNWTTPIFTKVPAELRAQLIETLKTRPEFKQALEATVRGAGVNLSLRMPEPIEFACEGLRFTAFGWMGRIYVIGEEVPPSDF